MRNFINTAVAEHIRQSKNIDELTDILSDLDLQAHALTAGIRVIGELMTQVSQWEDGRLEGNELCDLGLFLHHSSKKLEQLNDSTMQALHKKTLLERT
ncbi:MULTISPECIES: hypothetical protein [Pasteurellaceae]|uniref:Uncharacterized protein n=1 Tax=Pasteurella atlantica TaxID=2827233 RepID=A0AAW8CGY2_9PAST|nr:hypothetical protein [Pasteurella atlantica]MBR0573858.1 hypothetical protein [Pasteurella atlantica]MDP8039250.1 hypothetical protein [Pasteurella atlantica]MDP8041341.1 hypothetical protein [Pasteurella atlantica]MDP8043477.1 hypothetical protein [Pasteurella atlantica]MDP8045604.1 hypothetical protein [Pasteurella atlantica]